MSSPNTSTLSTFKFIFDHSAIGLVLLNEHFEILAINQATENLLKISREQVLNKVFFDLKWYQLAPFASTVDQTHTSRRSIIQREINWQIYSDLTVAFDLAVTALESQENASEPANILLEFFPLDRMMRINKDEALWDSQEATQAMIRGFAHEVKNPLGGIKGAAQLMQRTNSVEDRNEYTAIIVDEVDRLTDLVDRMLGPRKPLAPEFINIHEILERVKKLVEADQRYSIKIRRDYDTSLPLICVDRHQLLQSLLNIVQNAVQACGEYRKQINEENSRVLADTITLRTRVLHQETIHHRRYKLVLSVSIIDNGPGISDSVKNTLFYPMVSGRANGSGLGLAIAQWIVYQHKGSIECESEPGHTCFKVLIPWEVT
ncbi:MAG: nitrogen regulation protein NR(II) [Pseudomonadota bacterium]